jgi:hypothetical protein
MGASDRAVEHLLERLFIPGYRVVFPFATAPFACAPA